MKFYHDKNKTLLGLIYTDDRIHVEKVSYSINNIFLPFCAFSVIVTCTIILVIKLQKKTRWREKSSTENQAQTISKRNQKVGQMVVMVFTLFIVCFVPLCVFFIAMVFEPDLNIFGKYRNILLSVGEFICQHFYLLPHEQ